jgi:hypothetical protein
VGPANHIQSSRRRFGGLEQPTGLLEAHTGSQRSPPIPSPWTWSAVEEESNGLSRTVSDLEHTESASLPGIGSGTLDALACRVTRRLCLLQVGLAVFKVFEVSLYES